MKKPVLVIASAFTALTLTLAGCAKAPTTNPTGKNSASASGSASPFKACMVSDSGGFDDRSFNETSYNGLVRAEKELKVNTAKIESKNQSDFPGNIKQMINQKCTLIITVGFLLKDATITAAKANPNINFAIVDQQSEGKLKNHKGLIFNTAESSFLAGYLAASLTKTGKVGTFGGQKISTVTIFMDGFSQGTKYFNKQKGKNVQVLGWDADKQDGQFVAGGFEDKNGGKVTSDNLVSQGADILFPVAGPAGAGALTVAKNSKGKVNVIWVDADGYKSNEAQFRPLIISSVVKKMDEAVFDVIKNAKDGKFSPKTYVGTLKNEGTGLSPYHDFESKIPDATKKEIKQLKDDIISGKIKIDSKAQPNEK